MSTKRRDNRNRILRDRESQCKNGRYRYSFYEGGKQKSFYSWKLEPTDKLPPGNGSVSLCATRLQNIGSLKTGLRISEFCGLTTSDLDMKQRTIHIDHGTLRHQPDAGHLHALSAGGRQGKSEKTQAECLSFPQC